MAMKLSEAIAEIERFITFTGMPQIIMEEENRIHFAVSAYRTYENGGEHTEHGDGSFTIFCNNEGGFDPDSLHFKARGEHHLTDLAWRWDGESFKPFEEKEKAASSTATTSDSSS